MANSVRYIRDYLNGSLGNGASYWVEIQAFDDLGTNIASGKTVTANFTPIEGVLTQVTNDDTNTNLYVASADANSYVTIDLGAAYDIASVTRWHYNGDGRTFYDTKTQTSVDGTTWLTIFDSVVSGTYAEQTAGRNDATAAGLSAGLYINSQTFYTARVNIPSIVGVTRDRYGATLDGVTVNLFTTADNVLRESTTSSVDGDFVLHPTVAGPFYIVTYKSGSPDVTGASRNDLMTT